MDWFRNWLDRRSSSSPPRPSRRTVALESLESRLLMSADLIGSVSAAAIPDDVLPGDKFNVSVLVRNVGTGTSDYTPVVRLYASNTGQVDAQSIALGESNLDHPDIRAGKSVSVNVTADASRIRDTGNFSLFAVVDATNKVRESNENNNVAVAGKPLHVVWSFGSVPGHGNTDSITLTDDFGTRVTFTLTGPGRGDVVRGEDGFDLHLTGTNTNSVLKIATSGGRGYTDLGDVAVDGSLKQIEGAKANLLGDLSIGGTVRSIELRDIEDGAGIAIAGTGVPVKLIADAVVGASIHSASAFESISIEEWLPGASGRGVISAPSIGKLTVGGAFGADLDLTGAASGPTLSTVQIDGRITGGLWNIGGSAGQITAKSIEAPWQGSFEGAVQKIRTEQNLSGTLATPSIGTIDVGGSMIGAKLLIGAAPGGSFGTGNIDELRVGGSVTNSSIFVGVDPVDGIYGNSNDVIVGGAASRIQQIFVGGKLLGTTSFIAGAFPTFVRIHGQTVRSANVPQFHVMLPDTIAPQVSITLANDSGASASDGVTRDPTLAASVTDAHSIVSLLFAIDDFSPERQVDIQSFRQADGSLVIDEVLFASMLGGPLADGVHFVQLTARDATGNSSVKSFTFVLDRTVPALSQFDLAPESDGGVRGDRLTGSPVVAFNGVAAPNLAFELLGTGASGVTHSDGSFRIENVALAEGENHFTLRLTDLAGNQTVSQQGVRLDSMAPTLQVSLILDTGSNPSDGVTSNASMTAFATDNDLLASWSVGIDDGSDYSELLTDPFPRVSFTVDGFLLNQIAGGFLGDGSHTLRFTVYDMAGNATMQEIPFVLDRSVPPGPRFGLAPGSDTGVQGDQVTRDDTVTLQGFTEANAALTLSGSDRNTVSDASGFFSFDGVALAEGQNILFVQAVDVAGNASQAANVLYRDSVAPELSVRLANDTGTGNSDGRTRDPSLGGQLVDAGSVVSLTVSIDGGPAVEYQTAPTTSTGFYIDGTVLDGQAGGFLLNGPHTYRVTATDAAGNVTIADLDFVLERNGQPPLLFDLAPESDTGMPGDQRTTASTVTLAGTADAGNTLTLNGVPVAPAGPDGVFRIEGVELALGANTFMIEATGPTGQVSAFTLTIYRDEVPVQTGLFPDLVVSGIRTEVLHSDPFGTMLRVSWTTSNEGPAAAAGRHGAWAESVHLSYDDIPWNGDWFLGNLKVTSTLAPGASEEHFLDVFVESWFGPGYRIYVVTDDEQGIFDPVTGVYEYFANEVAEKDVGEFNDLAIQDVPSGIPPAPIAPAAPGPLPLDGTAVGGSLEGGGSIVYTFDLADPARLYFDSLSESPGMAWTLRTAGGVEVAIRSFAASDAYGFGTANPLLSLLAGAYVLEVSNASAEAGDYGFRLLDPDLAAFDNLVLDGGPVLRETLERGNWTDIYQFEATAGTRYVAGGPNDWAVDGGLFWRLFDPDGNQIWTGTTSPSNEQAFANTGTYTLLVEGRVGRTDAQQYNAYVFTPQDREIALTTGQRIQGFLDSPGQVNTYRFTLEEATVAFFDGYLESNGPYFSWTLQGPGGIVETGSTRSDTTDAGGNPRLLNLTAGEYSLTIEGFDNAAGWYNFALFDLVHDAGTPLSLGQPAIDTLLPGFNSTLYRFGGAAGQQVTIDLNTMDPDWISYDPVHWLVVDGTGNVVAQGQAGTPAQATLGEAGSYALLIQAHQFNWYPVQYSVAVTPAGQAPGVVIGLDPGSDTGIIGDQRTENSMVNLAGTAAPNSQVTLAFLGLTTTADDTGTFLFENVFLQFGANPFIAHAVDTAGNESVAGARIVMEFPPTFSQVDLVASNVVSQVMDDGFGNLSVLVNWTTTNQGTTFAAGGPGFWNESVYYSMTDDQPFSGDDILIGSISIVFPLDPGFSQNNSAFAAAPALTPGGRFYVVVDDGNLVLETPEGELNNITMQA
ncbi:MAG TPA: Ig-like domain-containing protein [Burkholderiales bacterium]